MEPAQDHEGVERRVTEAIGRISETFLAPGKDKIDPIAFSIACAEFSGRLMGLLIQESRGLPNHSKFKGLALQLAVRLMREAGVGAMAATGPTYRDAIDKMRVEVNRNFPGQG